MQTRNRSGQISAVVFSFAVMTALAGVAFSIPGFAQQKPASAAKASAGAATFKAKCVMCHGADGTGDTPMGKQLKAFDLHSAQVQAHSNDELKQIITNGEGNMPPFDGQLTPAQIGGLVDYIRLWGKKAK